jgi:hypothetical protein
MPLISGKRDLIEYRSPWELGNLAVVHAAIGGIGPGGQDGRATKAVKRELRWLLGKHSPESSWRPAVSSF